MCKLNVYGGYHKMVKKVKMEPMDYLSKEKKLACFNSYKKDKVNLFNELLEASKGVEEKIAAEDLTMKVDYKTLLISCYVLGEKLETVLKNEDRVGVILPNSVGHVLALFSLFKIGKTPAILNFSMGMKTLMDCIETSQLKQIITSKLFVEKAGLEPLIAEIEKKTTVLYIENIKASITTKDKAKGFVQFQMKTRSKSMQNEIILFTSGSEAKPKGVVLTHQNVYSNIFQLYSSLILYPHDKFFNALPMFHSFGLTAGTLVPLLTRISVFLYPSPLHFKEIPQLVFKTQATFLLGTSTFLEKYEKYTKPYHFSTLRFAVAGGERLNPEVRDRYLLNHAVRVIEGYGATEASPVISLNTPYLFKNDTVGTLLPGIEYKIEPVEGIAEGGNLFIKGPNIMKGYLLHDKGFVPASEWYDTGDIVKVDEEGFITIVSRLKRFAKIAGEMISLHMVEQLASKCFKRTDFYAVSIRDEYKGEKVVLFSTFSDSKEAELRKFVTSQQLSTMYIPSVIQIIESVPLLGNGKVDYVTLTEQAKQLFNKD